MLKAGVTRQKKMSNHNAQSVVGEDSVEYFLGLTPSGIIVLRNKNKVGNYYWPRISKIYFKGRYFMIRISDKNNEENTYGFETPSKPACKHLWKCCVEHHAFFRLIQVSNTAPDLFSLGSKYRYSGRTEKQAQADAQLRLRSPPQFSRTPSRRYQRRIIEGSADVPKIEDRENIAPNENKMVTVPLPVNSVYRSTCSIPAVLPSHGRPESPRSTRSAPWSQPHVRGLYQHTSPRSVRSAGNTSQLLHKLTHRSSSVDSQSSNDSRSCKRHRRHRSRRGSDNESELSKGSSRSHHRHRRRSHSKRDSESEKDHKHHHRHRHKSGSSSRHRHGSQYELVDSEAQWREVQRRQAEGSTGVHQATVINNKDRRSGYMNSGMETESEMSYHLKRKQKKQRSRSKSPTEPKPRLPDELKKHLEFNLIDTSGMSESQLREIPYTVVQTPGSSKHRKHSPNSKRKHTNSRKNKSSHEESRKTGSMESPPPPYTPNRDDPHGDQQQNKHSNIHISSGDSGNFSNTGPGSNSSSTSNSALGEFLNKANGAAQNGSGSSNHSPASSVTRTRSMDFKSPSLQNIASSHCFSSSYNSSPKLSLSSKKECHFLLLSKKNMDRKESMCDCIRRGLQSIPAKSPSSPMVNRARMVALPSIPRHLSSSMYYGNSYGDLNWNSESLRSSQPNINRRVTERSQNAYPAQRGDYQDVYKRFLPLNQDKLGLPKSPYSVSNHNSSLPPLPYGSQSEKSYRTTRLNHPTRTSNNEFIASEEKKKIHVENRQPLTNDWRRQSYGKEDNANRNRRIQKPQPSPRTLRSTAHGQQMPSRLRDEASLELILYPIIHSART